MQHHYPVGSAQAKVLKALALTAANFDEANAIFAHLGFRVDPVRVGRSSEPSIVFLDDAAGYVNGDSGDVDVAERIPAHLDLSPLAAFRAFSSDPARLDSEIAASVRQAKAEAGQALP